MGFLCLHEVRPSLWSYVNVFRALETVGPGPVQYCQCVHPEAPLCCQEVLKSVQVLQVYRPSSTLDKECYRCSVAFLFTTGICLNICFPLPHSDAPSLSPLSPLPQRLLRQVTFSKSSQVKYWQMTPLLSVFQLFPFRVLQCACLTHVSHCSCWTAELEPGLSLTISSTGCSINKGMRSGAVVCDTV